MDLAYMNCLSFDTQHAVDLHPLETSFLRFGYVEELALRFLLRRFLVRTKVMRKGHPRRSLLGRGWGRERERERKLRERGRGSGEMGCKRGRGGWRRESKLARRGRKRERVQ